MSDHMMSKFRVGDFVVHIWNQSDDMLMTYNSEIKMSSIWNSFYFQCDINLELCDFVSVDSNFTVVHQSDIQEIKSSFFQIKIARTCLTRACDNLAGQEFISHPWDNFVKIASVELEKAGFPIFSIEIRIELSIFNSILECIFVYIKGNEFLNTTIDSEQYINYCGLRGRVGALYSHFQAEQFLILAIQEIVTPSYQISKPVALMEYGITNLPLGPIHQYSLYSSRILLLSYRFRDRQQLYNFLISSQSSCRTVVTLMISFSSLCKLFKSYVEILAGEIRVMLICPLLKWISSQASNTYNKYPSLTTYFMANEITSLSAFADPVPVEMPAPSLDQSKSILTSNLPPSITTVSLPMMSARCLLSMQKNCGLILPILQMAESLTFQLTLFKTLTFSLIFVNVMFNQFCLPKQYSEKNSRWVLLQFWRQATDARVKKMKTILDSFVMRIYIV